MMKMAMDQVLLNAPTLTARMCWHELVQVGIIVCTGACTRHGRLHWPAQWPDPTGMPAADEEHDSRAGGVHVRSDDNTCLHCDMLFRAGSRTSQGCSGLAAWSVLVYVPAC